jgi:aminocarboxymuconate-semialdehyde decarboxylase
VTGIIDVHCHVMPAELPALPAGVDPQRWPYLRCDGGHRVMEIGGAAYRRFDERNWSVERRIADMDAAGVARQVLSPLPELLSYWFAAPAAAEMARHVNGAIAAMVARAPDRFAGLAMVPLQDPDRAAAMVAGLAADGFLGVEIGSNIDGISPAGARFDAFYTALREAGLALFVHGVRPAAADRLIGHAALPAIIGVPMDTALCLASMISTDILARHPGLRLGFSHGGGAIGSLLGRFSHVHAVMPELAAACPAPLAAASRFFYDLLTFDAEYTRFLLGLLGPEQFFVGTDYPAGGMGLMRPAQFLDTLQVAPAWRHALAQGNARRFLGIPEIGGRA